MNLLLLLNELGRDMHEWGGCLAVADAATVAKGSGTDAAATLVVAGDVVMAVVVRAGLAMVAADRVAVSPCCGGCGFGFTILRFSDSLLLLQIFAESLRLLPLTVEAADATEEAAARLPGANDEATSGGGCIDSWSSAEMFDAKASGAEDAVAIAGVSDCWLGIEAGVAIVLSVSAAFGSAAGARRGVSMLARLLFFC